MKNPFPPTASQPGQGRVHLALLPPSVPVLRTLTYQYPLKLISPAPVTVTSQLLGDASYQVHTLYVLTYGGGIVAGDTLSMHIELDRTTRLVVLTQGSTKIFKTPAATTLSRQDLDVRLAPGASVVYLPDPVQPFAQSAFVQTQRYHVLCERAQPRASLCILDWVCQGRKALGEDWDFWKYGSKNEVWLVDESEARENTRLLLRDNVLLDADNDSIAKRMDGLGAFGTLILHGSMFDRLGKFFMDEFKAIPRIGGRKWDTTSEDGDVTDEVNTVEMKRKARQKQETADGLIWTAAAVRGCVVVKFGAREVEGGKRWLRWMLETEGSVPDQFGERALLCLR